MKCTCTTSQFVGRVEFTVYMNNNNNKKIIYIYIYIYILKTALKGTISLGGSEEERQENTENWDLRESGGF